MSGNEIEIRRLDFQDRESGEAISLELPATIVRTIWRRGTQSLNGYYYVDPLVIKVTVHSDKDGNLSAERVEAFGALASVGPLPHESPFIEVFVDTHGVTDWLSFDKSERPLAPADFRLIAKTGDADQLGNAIASHCKHVIAKRHELTQAEIRAMQRKTGSKRARVDDDDMLLISDAVRRRQKGVTATKAVQDLKGYQKSRAHQLVRKAVAEGYLREDEVKS